MFDGSHFLWLIGVLAVNQFAVGQPKLNYMKLFDDLWERVSDNNESQFVGNGLGRGRALIPMPDGNPSFGGVARAVHCYGYRFTNGLTRFREIGMILIVAGWAPFVRCRDARFR